MLDPSVFFVANLFDELGGASQLLTTLALALHRRGSRVAVYTALPNPTNPYVPRLLQEGITVHEGICEIKGIDLIRRYITPLSGGATTLPGIRKLSRLHVSSPPLRFYRDVVAERAKGRTVAVHVHRGPQGLVWADRVRAPSVYVENSFPSSSTPEVRWWFDQVARDIPRAQVVASGSKAAAESVREHYAYRGPVYVLPWLVEDTPEVTTRRAIGPTPVVGFAGRLSREKGAHRLIEAAARLDIRVDLAGDGPELGELKRRASELRVHDRIRFLGTLDSEGLETFYQDIDVLVLPSSIEGMPLVVLEACVRGVPVIASAVGGLPELLPPSCLVPPGDTEAIVRKLEQLPQISKDLTQVYRRIRSERLATRGIEPWVQMYRNLVR